MKIMYKTNKWDSKIEPIEIVRETPKQVVVMDDNWRGVAVEKREAKESNYAIYHETWEQARSYLAVRAIEKMEVKKNLIAKARLAIIDLGLEAAELAKRVNPDD